MKYSVILDQNSVMGITDTSDIQVEKLPEVFTFWKVRRKSELSTCVVKYVCLCKAFQLKFNLQLRDMIGRSMTALKSLLALSLCYPSATFVSLCRKENLSALFKNFSLFTFSKTALSLQLRHKLKLSKSGGACMSVRVLLCRRRKCHLHVQIINYPMK